MIFDMKVQLIDLGISVYLHWLRIAGISEINGFSNIDGENKMHEMGETINKRTLKT